MTVRISHCSPLKHFGIISVGWKGRALHQTTVVAKLAHPAHPSPVSVLLTAV